MRPVKVHLIAAARPNFMKVAPLFHALSPESWCDVRIIHTGQHYDVNMSAVFFRDLGLKDPDFSLGVGSGTHAEQTGRVMIAYEKVCIEDPPDWIVVAGDVNSTAACAMVGAKLWIPVIHLEAGLRSNDRRMPEEINRIVTDSISDVLWTPSTDADENLRREGVDAARIEMIGNIMIDSFEMLRPRIETSDARARFASELGKYGLVTMHRPSNVDRLETLEPIVEALAAVAKELPLLLVAHPRTRKSLETFALDRRLTAGGRVSLLEPMPYVEFMSVVTGASVVITDSGGLQEETTYLDIPCLTLRENTERPITLTQGTNQLVTAETLSAATSDALGGTRRPPRCPPLWDGRTALRARDSLRRRAGIQATGPDRAGSRN